MSIYDVYKINEASQDVEVTAFGEWSEANGLHILEKEMWKRRRNLKGEKLR